jgi:hypothetical protein
MPSTKKMMRGNKTAKPASGRAKATTKKASTKKMMRGGRVKMMRGGKVKG